MVLPAPFGPSSADDLAALHLERHVVERGGGAPRPERVAVASWQAERRSSWTMETLITRPEPREADRVGDLALVCGRAASFKAAVAQRSVVLAAQVADLVQQGPGDRLVQLRPRRATVRSRLRR